MKQRRGHLSETAREKDMYTRSLGIRPAMIQDPLWKAVGHLPKQRDTEEKRRHERFQIEYIDLAGKIILASEVTVLDLSVGGIAVKADRRLEIGREYSVALKYQGKNLSLRCIVMWSVLAELRKGLPGERVPMYKAGLKITSSAADSLKDLVDFIASHKTEELAAGEPEVSVAAGSDNAEGQRPEEQPSPDLLERIDYYYTWHKTLDYYRILSLRRYATDDEVKKAYYAMAQDFHPDRHSGLPDDLRHKIGEVFILICAAYKTLIDPQLRIAYDRTLSIRRK